MAHEFRIRSYFDPNEIIFAESRVGVDMPVGAFQLGPEFGAIDNNTGERTEHINPNTKINAPLWAAEVMKREGFGTVRTAATVSTGVFREFQQDPMGPNMRAKSEFFYELAAAGAALGDRRESVMLRKSITSLHRRRYPAVLLAGGRKGLDYAEARDALASVERRVLDRYMENTRSEEEWCKERSGTRRDQR